MSVDYGFTASKWGVGVTILVPCASRVPRKGTSGQLAATRLDAFLRELRIDRIDVSMKSDGEAAITAVVDNAQALWPSVRAIRGEARRGSCGTDGVVQRAI